MMLRKLSGTLALAIAFCCPLWCQQSPANDVLSVEFRGNPEQFPFSAMPLAVIQGKTAAFAMNHPQGDILRFRVFGRGMDAGSLSSHLPGFQLSSLKPLRPRPGTIDPEYVKQAGRAGWLFGAATFPPLPNFTVGVASSLKHGKEIPVCVVRLVHTVPLYLKSQLTSQQHPSEWRFQLEYHLSQQDPFCEFASWRSYSEYILAVELAPTEHPFVQRLRQVLPESVPIYIQLMPDGRPELATLASQHLWAGLIEIMGTPAYDQYYQAYLRGWGGREVTDDYVQRVMRNAANKMDYYHRLRDSIDLGPPPMTSIQLPGGPLVQAPASFVFNDTDAIWSGLQTGEIETNHERSSIILALALARNTEDNSSLFEAERPAFLPPHTDLPMALTADRRVYSIPIETTPNDWLARIQQSMWAEEFHAPMASD